MPDSVRYWWVNHKKTAKQEIGGGFLWSPFREKNGYRSHFYDNMKRTRPGDTVFSYSETKIAYVGTVSDYCMPFPKPTTFGTAGEGWSQEGWLVPVTWMAAARTVRPKDYIARIAPLLPSKYSPIQPQKGNGNQKAYLTEISCELGALLFDLAQTTAPAFGGGGSNIPGSDHYEDLYLSQPDLDQKVLEDTEALAERKARRGQGKFRQNVFSVEKACRFSGLSNPTFLVASHIKPWRLCGSAKERLDGNNGLLLTPNVDLLFDRGLLTVLPDGSVVVAKALDEATLGALGLSDYGTMNVGPFSDRQRGYLEYHNKCVFVDGA